MVMKDPTLKILNSLVKVFPDEEPAGANFLYLSGLQGETVSFVVAYKGSGNKKEAWKLDVTSPVNIRIRTVELVPAAYPCHPGADDNYLRTRPGLYPDLLRDLEYMEVYDVPGQWRSLWVDVTLTEGPQLRDFKIQICFSSAERAYKKSVTACLHTVPAVLPPQKLLHTEWFHADCLADYYKVDVWSEAHWNIVENFIRLYGARGMNMILTPVITPALDTEVGGERTTVQLLHIEKNKEMYSFDFKNVKRWIDLCKKYGVTHFEMPHLFTQWGAKHAPKIVAYEAGSCRKIFGWETNADSGEYQAFLKQYLGALTEFLKTEGLQDVTYFHISDEPEKQDLEFYKKARESVLPYIKGFQTADALSDPSFYEQGLVGKFAPATDHIDVFLEKGIKGLWTYYCTAQSKAVANRFMAMPSGRNRILGIQLYLYEIEAFLHWGFNFYNTQFSKKPVNPYLVTDAGNAFPSGDAFLVYPGKDGIPEESIRLMVLQEAFQDIRALTMLEGLIGRKSVLNIIHRSVTAPITFTHYPKEPDYLIKLRTEINQEIESLLTNRREENIIDSVNDNYSQ